MHMTKICHILGWSWSSSENFKIQLKHLQVTWIWIA